MRILFSLFALAFPLSVAASGLDQLKAFVDNTKTARGSFVQSVAGKQGRKPKDSAGTFALARPGKFRWNYEKPYQQLLVADGEKLWSFDPDLNQVTVKKLGQAFGSSPAALLAGGALEAHFVLKEGGQAEGMEMVEALPKSPDSSFDRVRIGLRDNLPRVMEVRDVFGQVTTLLFTDFQANPNLPREQFKFVPPKGADVVGE